MVGTRASDHHHSDYLAFEEPLLQSPPAQPQRKSWILALGSILLLVASLAYTAADDSQWSHWAGAKPKANTLLAYGGYGDATNQVMMTVASGRFKDGRVQVVTITVPPEHQEDPPSFVVISAPGIQFKRTKFEFSVYDPKSFTQTTLARTITGAQTTDGIESVTVTFTYPSGPAETMAIPREVKHGGRCSGWGDPHVTTFDGAAYDFQPHGVFRWVETHNILIQVFQDYCPNGQPGFSCFRAVAITYGDSVLRLYLDGGKVVLAKGSDSLKWFDVVKFGGATEGYRVFTTVDRLSYIDVTSNFWVGSTYYLNIAFQGSPYFRDANVRGLMGNWNGYQWDDATDTTQLTQAHSVNVNQNLFTCTGTGCSSWLKPATQEDELAMQFPADWTTLRAGFNPISVSSIPRQTYNPVLIPLVALARELEGVASTNGSHSTDPMFALRAMKLCEQAISSVPDCEKYVPNKSFFIQNVCVSDAVVAGDLAVVDSTKLGYLRECRREMEAELVGAAGVESSNEKQLEKDHATLEFGDLKRCPLDCHGRGDCLAAGCKCRAGYTGYTCEIEI